MNPKRFDLALERLPSSDWERFERLASIFLATEYPKLRTVASPAGDQGRDAYLFQEEGDPSVLIQYSVSEDWRGKIRDTARRINETFPETRVLVYMSNRVIGASADSLRDEIRRDRKLFLDVCDRSWFVERVNFSAEREAAAEDLAVAIADPYLAGKGVIETKGQALGSLEMQTAFVYLALQWEDDSREKGLTKIAFDALVRAALRDTDSDHRMSRGEVKERVHALLPAHSAKDLGLYVDAALGRLTKKVLRHWQKPDEFCLTFDERERLTTQLTALEHDDRALDETLSARVAELGKALRIVPDADPVAVVQCVRAIIEKVLLARGEAFVRAVDAGRLGDLPLGKLVATAVTELAASGRSALDADGLTVARATAIDVLTEPPDEAQSHLRSLAESYTLFAFLRETPNVQSVIVKMFSGGEIWLDTSVVLPLFAEELLEPLHRSFTNILAAGREAGLKLYITGGVLEEIEAHMRLSLTYSRWDASREAWRGHVPFLYGAFALTGRSRAAFGSWLETFRGDRRPVDDVATYLDSQFGIAVRDLSEDAEKVPAEIRTAVRDVWQRIHERRRLGDSSADPHTALMLADHDTENYLGSSPGGTKSAILLLATQPGGSRWMGARTQSRASCRSFMGSEGSCRRRSAPTSCSPT